MAWGPNGAQQVWGLAVPAWRMPFELVARLIGQRTFPDRIAFAFLVFLIAYFLTNAFVLASGSSNEATLNHLSGNPGYPIAALILTLFPPMFPLCIGLFRVYDQPSAYGYFCSIGLLAGTILFARRPRLSSYLILSTLAGLIGFVRPTMLAYGGATLVVCTSVALFSGWRITKVSSGPIVFGFGMLMLFLTNQYRFGSGFEFGHRINMTETDVMLFSRFHAPFDKEPIWSATSELVGLLFFVRNFNDVETYYNDGLVALQSQTTRLRALYGHTFNLVYLCSLIGSATWLIWKLSRGRKNGLSIDRDLLVLSAWGLLSAAAVGAFYLRFFAVGSRYLLDFSAAFAAIVAFSIIASLRFARLRARAWFSVILIVSLTGWWITEVNHRKTTKSDLGPVVQAELIQRSDAVNESAFVVPERYAIGSAPKPSETGIAYNGVGWNIATGQTKSVVALYIESPAKLHIEVAPVDGHRTSDKDYLTIRAKIGLEELKLHSIVPTPSGQLLTFHSPENEIYRAGVQVAFICFARPGEYLVRRSDSSFRLLSVEW